MSDVPTLTDEDTANFAVINPLHIAGTASNGNLTHTNSAGGSWQNSFGTIHISSGKWYWEGTVSGGIYHTIGVATSEIPLTYGWGTPSSGSAFAYIDTSGNKIGPTGYGGGSSYGASFTSGDVIGVALDSNSGTLTFYKNGVSQGVAFSSGLASTLVSPIFGEYNSVSWDINFGQRPFAYTPPTGFKKLNTFNLPDSSIVDGSKNFNTVTYTGQTASSTFIDNGDGTWSQTGLNFPPDFVWSKSRSGVKSHILQDSVRGPQLYLQSNATSLEASNTQTVRSFDTNGYTIGSTGTFVNESGVSFAAWTWKAGGTAVSNTDGDITSTVSANPTAGFSVVTYSGSNTVGTVGHGLGVVPNMIIVKRTNSGTDGWQTYHSSLGNTGLLYLNSTQAVVTGVGTWQSTTPTTTKFYLEIGSGGVNASGGTYVAYCFADVEGYSKIGSYTGNGSADGPFVYTGFKPAFIMFRSTSLCNWVIVDTARSTYNVIDDSLYPNTNGAEITTITDVDFLSNGFKWRGVLANETNASGQTYIYMAFAENPFKNSLAR
jgi:hypothetical protein